MAGIPVSATEINLTGGDLSRQLENLCNRAAEFKAFLDQFTAQDLVDRFGMTLDDATVIKSAYGEIAIVVQAQRDNHTFQQRIWGLGDVAA
jgi:predicted RNA-binding Zn ribbon-like protein